MHRDIEIEVCTLKSAEFKAWMELIERMNRNQRDKLRKRLAAKEDADEVIALIERSHDGKPACPDCKAIELYRWGKVSELIATLSLSPLQSHT